jgi:hypothetical protein
MCDRCLIMDRGRLVFDGDVVTGVARYLESSRTAARDPLVMDAALMDVTSGLRASSDTGVVIEDFGVAGLRRASICTGDSVRVHLRYRSDRHADVRWGFCLLTANLETTIACEGTLEPVSIRAGVGELAATLRLPLTGGRYALRVAIMDARNELPLCLRGFDDPPRYFTVDMPTTLRNNYRTFMRDLIVLEEPVWEETEISSPLTQPAAAVVAAPCAADSLDTL